MTNLADSTKLQGGVKKFEDFIHQRSLVDLKNSLEVLHSKCQLCPAFSYLPTSILTKRPNLVHPLVAIRNYRVILSAVAGIIERNLIKCLHLHVFLMLGCWL